MSVIGVDAKSFLRKGVPPDGGPASLDYGYRSHLGTVVEVRDLDHLTQALRTSIAENGESFGLRIRTPLVSAQRLRKWWFPDDKSHRAFIKMLHEIKEAIVPSIKSLRYTWLSLPPTVGPITLRGGNYPKEVSWKNFHSRAQSFGSLLAAADFVNQRGPPTTAFVDNFACNLNMAWKDLNSKCKNLQIIPHGDEVNAAITAADLIGYITDRVLDVSSPKMKLNDQSLQKVWKDYGLDVESRFFSQKTMGWIEFRSNNQVPVSDYYPAPMIYAFIGRNPGSIGNSATNEQPLRYAFEGQKLVDVPMVKASEAGGGFKFWEGRQDIPGLRGSDILVYAGKDQEKIAQDVATFAPCRLMSVGELRSELSKTWPDLQ